MTAGSYLIDTNLRVNAIRRKKGRLELLRQLVETGGSLACSVTTAGALYAGMRPHEKDRTLELLSGFEEFEVTGELARYAGLLKCEWGAKGYLPTLPDMIIAATAMAHWLVVVTENRKDFPMVPLASVELGGALWNDLPERRQQRPGHPRAAGRRGTATRKMSGCAKKSNSSVNNSERGRPAIRTARRRGEKIAAGAVSAKLYNFFPATIL